MRVQERGGGPAGRPARRVEDPRVEGVKFIQAPLYLALTVTDRFLANCGLDLLKPPAIKAIFLGRLSGPTTYNSQPPWRRAELPGAALASRGAGDALRGAGKLYERREP